MLEINSPKSANNIFSTSFLDTLQYSEQNPYDFSNSSHLSLDLAHLFMLYDTEFYLPSDILTKVDRSSMANSLEIRSPFLDSNLFNFAWSLPSNNLFRSNLTSLSGKAILRSLLLNYLPNTITRRPKHGFSVPMANWLRGPLRTWASDLLNFSEHNSFSFLNSTYINQLWEITYL